MDNLKRPAYPQPIAIRENGTLEASCGVHEDFAGLTKLERGALMIAHGVCAESTDRESDWIARKSVSIAKAVLEEANK